MLRINRTVQCSLKQRIITSATSPQSAARARTFTPSAVSLGSPSLNAHVVHQRRSYHYEHQDVYGFRPNRPMNPIQELSHSEIKNRIDAPQLLRLVEAYREKGHAAASLDPLGLHSPNAASSIKELNLARYGLDTLDPNTQFSVEGIISCPNGDPTTASLASIIDHLNKSYCSTVGFEFAHIPNEAEQQWFAQHVESYKRQKATTDEKLTMYQLLSKSEVFDQFMAKRFPQVKRYGLEGAESMMIVLDTIFRDASMAGIKDLIFCMPHRGRLNLLTDILQYPPAALFHKIKGGAEFPEDIPAMGDVLSHIAQTVDLQYGAKDPLHVSLLHNPSHLETANPVALGNARARQMYMYDSGIESKECTIGDKVLCVQLHGDSAFTGQGVVTETLGLANLPHFTAGGSIHLIVNNQIGYTTPAMNARSTVYTSDIGKMIDCPIIHVNADYPEDVAFAAATAAEYRNKFRKDVILDLIAYRRMGHNELDEPAFTQPLMYKNIRARKSVPLLYEDQLLAEGVIKSRSEVEAFRKGCSDKLDKDLEESYSYKPVADTLGGKWNGMIFPREAVTKIDTGIELGNLKIIGKQSVATPTGFKVHSRLGKFHVENRTKKVEAGEGVDWATGEALAFGSLLSEGYNVRISGQDVGRGTFSQRHAMLVDQETERTVIPLNHLNTTSLQPSSRGDSSKKFGNLEIANSNLSEYAVLGFEYGVSWESPNRLCIWEAQFGDFFNGAQIVIDTCLASGETKWLRQSGLVMLLPHGYDGAGPEHSSSRVERFLQLCDHKFDVLDDSIPDNPNMHVVNPTTPAQYFHVLRRQMIRNFRKPLIVVAPKTLLRHPSATSSLSEMSPGTTFQPILSDPIHSTVTTSNSSVETVIFVSGKLYYDLVKERKEQELVKKVALIRVEELNPFPTKELQVVISQFSNAKKWKWVQEEPENQGAYTFMQPRLQCLLKEKLQYHGRPASAAPATGISSRHKVEQASVIQNAFL